jgi:hypothetical protein
MGKAVTNSIVTTDEARRKLNLPKVKGGDVIWRQQQYYSLAALDERDRNNPFPEKQPPTPDNPQDQTATNEKSLAAALPIIRGWIQNSQRCH